MTLRSILLGSTGALLACGAAWGQTGPSGPQTETIIVTGTELSRQEGIAQKKDDARVIEALSSDELGQLPDKNIGESLNRLPGVSMLVEKGEGRYVQIRGVASNLNNVTINGVQMGSPEVELGGRQAPLDIISGGVLSKVQVVKTPTPDMDAQGIGGTVNVETAMPFDRKEDFYGFVTGRYGYEDIRPEDNAYAGHDPYALDGMVSGKIGDTFGWLLGATFSSREYIATGVYQDDWTQVPTTVPGSAAGTFLPVNVKNNYYVIGRERFNLNGAVEFRPDESSKYFVRGFYSTWDEYQHRNRYEQNLTFSRSGFSLTSPTSGTAGTDRILANIRLEYANKIVSSLAAGGENRFGALTVDYLVQANANEIEEPNDQWEWRSSTSAVGPSTWDINGDGVVTIRPNAGTPSRTNPGLLPLRRVRYFDRLMQEDALIGQINATWDFSEALEFKGGFKAARTERERNDGQDEFTGPGSLNLGSDPGFTRGGFVNETSQGDVPNIWMDVDGMNRYFAANRASFNLNTGAEASADFGSDYGIEETILAGYGMATAEFGPVQVIGGVRVEYTDVASEGYALGVAGPPRIQAGGDYTEVLPALLANYRPNDDLVFRAAVTRAMGRPDYDTIAPRTTFSDDGLNASISVGNPALKPRKSWNYDVSAEWYPDRLTAVSASLFYKDITDQLVGTSEVFDTQAEIAAELTRRGISGVDPADYSNLRTSTTINGGSAWLQGLELSAQTQFDFLPGLLSGLGGVVSATFVEGEVENADGTTSPLQGQPEQTYAFTLFYQEGPFDASVSYAYNASYLTDYNTDPNFSLDQGEFGRWDAKVAYSFTDTFKVFAEAVNINDEPTSEFQGGRENWNTEFENVGRTFYVGASYGF